MPERNVLLAFFIDVAWLQVAGTKSKPGLCLVMPVTEADALPPHYLLSHLNKVGAIPLLPLEPKS